MSCPDWKKELSQPVFKIGKKKKRLSRAEENRDRDNSLESLLNRP